MLNHGHRKILLNLSPGKIYLVGGSVRDSLLGRAGNDIDLTVVGDASKVAREFAQATGGECTLHERFGTATVRVGPASIDFITARSETYPTPGALPVVRPGTLENDLARRDFSINAMALSLDDDALFDHQDGRMDLDNGVIRTLHPHSFYDDPTRIFRAVRYEQRLGFKMDELTEFQLTCAVGNQALDHVSGNRVRREIEKAAEEENPLPIFRRMSDLGIFQAIHPRWQPDLEKIPEDWCPEGLGWMVLTTWDCEPDLLEGIVKRLNMPKEQAKAMRGGAETHQGLLQLKDDATPAEVCLLLDPAGEILERLDLGKAVPWAQGAIAKYLSEWRHVRPELGGRDLVRMGIPQGPEMARLMTELRTLRLNHRSATRQDEEKVVEHFLAGKNAD